MAKNKNAICSNDSAVPEPNIRKEGIKYPKYPKTYLRLKLVAKVNRILLKIIKFFSLLENSDSSNNILFSILVIKSTKIAEINVSINNNI